MPCYTKLAITQGKKGYGMTIPAGQPSSQ